MNCTKKKLVVKNRFRFTLFMVVLAVAVSTVVFAFMLPDRTSADVSHKTELVLVAPGDTLWSIAEAYMGKSGDIREMVYQLKQLNHLPSADLAVGQTIAVPCK